MRMGIWAFCLFTIIALLLFLFSSYLSDTVNEIISYIDKADNFVEKSNYEEAKKIYKTINKVWEKKERRLLFQIDKREFDEITATLYEIEALLNKNLHTDYFPASYRLRFYIKSLYEKNIVSLETIL